MTKIKICGITREEDALFCASEGADLIGFIFVPSTPRFIEPERAAGIAARVREQEKRPKIVGVFRDASNDYIREIHALVCFDIAQLHGSETDEDVRDLGIPVIKTLRVGDTLPDTHGSPNAAWLLFDTFDERRAGGTGRRFDWSVLATYERSKPFFLSGGIDPENAVAAISLVRPDAIDLSSGVESAPGIKDHEKVARLFERVRRG
ncbi:MAG TPA: phosphoribosylanthranilate isomerase [Thermoanaerobaculia bacterium]|nr:phosphoribosylanthranilate isomerase [Thermoanaerobaculia bacterium]